MVNDDVTFGELWRRLPPVSRTLTAVALAERVYAVMFPYSQGKLWLMPGSVTRQRQLFRLLTSPLACQGSGFSAVLTLVSFYYNLSSLECGKFRGQRAEMIWYLVLVTLSLQLLGPHVGLFAFLSALADVFTYTQAQEAPNEVVHFMVVDVPRKYMPWINVGIGILSSGFSAFYMFFLGLLIGHAYLYFDELLPSCGGPMLTRVPRFVRNQKIIQGAAIPQTESTRAGHQSGFGTGFNSRFYGKGQRLGS